MKKMIIMFGILRNERREMREGEKEGRRERTQNSILKKKKKFNYVFRI